MLHNRPWNTFRTSLIKKFNALFLNSEILAAIWNVLDTFYDIPSWKIYQLFSTVFLDSSTAIYLLQWNLDLRKPDLRKNLDWRIIVGATNFLVHKLFELRKIFQALMFDLRNIFFQKVEKNRDFFTILEQFLGVFSFFFQLLAWKSTIQFKFIYIV